MSLQKVENSGSNVNIENKKWWSVINKMMWDYLMR